jgi:hypothetical protein
MLDSLTKIDRRIQYLDKYLKNRSRRPTNSSSLKPVWQPQHRRGCEGGECTCPQVAAYNSEADVIGYGGAAGGGKTDLLLGFAGTKHRRSIIFRRVFPSVRGIIERSREIYNARGDTHAKDSYNESLHVWRLADGRLVEFGAVQYEKDRKKHQGQPRDFYGFDEATEFPESIIRFLIGWNRTTAPGQKCRVVMTFNPPMDDAGDWVTRFYGPWLDANHPQPARDGELRWFAMVDGQEQEVGPEPFEHKGERVIPKSRTFFHASLKDNPILAATGYGATIDAMPEPLRSLLRGNFSAARGSDPWQVIPGDWVRAAQKRWRETVQPSGHCSALGVDVARGGADQTVIAKRYGNWVAPLVKLPGRSTPDGPAVAALVMANHEPDAKVHLDAIGVGTSPFDILKGNGVEVTPIIASEGSGRMDKSGKLKFRNLRAEMFWRLREALDPTNGDNLALPPDPELLGDLTAPRWVLSINGIQIESKDDIKERIGRSTDCGDAVAMACWIDTRGQFEQGKWRR